MKRAVVFNSTCISLCALFVLGTGYVWRGAFVHAQDVQDVTDVQIVQYEDFTTQQHNNTATLQQNDDLEDNEVSSSTEEITEDEVEIGVLDVPLSINLAVPFTSQAPEKNWDQPWQDACEEAAVLMLDAYYKDYGLSPLSAKDEILKMVEWEDGVHGWGRSIEIEKIEELTRWYIGDIGVKHIRIIENPTIEQLKSVLAAGNPVLVVADGKTLPNPHFRSGGPAYHALVIRGYTEDRFITNDPGTQFGENFTYLYDELMNSIRDWNGGDVKSGKRVVLVLE